MAPKSLIGKAAPTITLPNYDGESYTLTPGEDGIPIALFFYPKSGSYGCTKEACQFRDAIVEKDTFKTDKVKIVGISADSVEKQKKFVETHKLTYPVLSDEKGEARKAYQVGKGFFGLVNARTTFIIDGKGIVRGVVDATLNYGAHSKFVAKWLSKLEAENTAEAPAASEAEVEAEAEAVPEATSEATSEPVAEEAPKLDEIST